LPARCLSAEAFFCVTSVSTQSRGRKTQHNRARVKIYSNRLRGCICNRGLTAANETVSTSDSMVTTVLTPEACWADAWDLALRCPDSRWGNRCSGGLQQAVLESLAREVHERTCPYSHGRAWQRAG